MKKNILSGAITAILVFLPLHLFGQGQIPAPALTVQQDVNDTIVLTWPSTAAGFVLEQTRSIGPTSLWSAVPQPPESQANRFLVRLTLAPEDRFFRLRAASISTNLPPVLEAIGDQVVALGSMLVLQLVARDPNQDPLVFSASPSPLPANASLDAVAGLFKFKPDTNQVSLHNLTFRVNDGRDSDSETITLNVTGANPNGVTSLSGWLLDTTDFTTSSTLTPVVGVAVSVLGATNQVTTDSTGRFVLSGIPAGKQVLDLNAMAALPAPDGSPYAGFREERVLIANVTNVEVRPFFLPRLDRSSLTTVDPSKTTVVANTNLNITFAIPPNTAKLAGGSNFTGQMSISLVPEGVGPSAMSEDLQPGLLITLQPIGVTFTTPVPITFPNFDNLAPGSETDLWSLDAGTGQFAVVGTGRVTADGKNIETISGGIRANDWHFPAPPPPPPSPPDDDDPPNDDDDDDCKLEGGSIVTVKTGSLRTDFTTPPYFSLGQARSLRFVYETRRASPYPIIPLDLMIPVRSAVPPTLSYQLNVGGVDQGNEVFVDTSSLDENKDEPLRIATSFDASALPSGSYPYAIRSTSNYRLTRISSNFRGRVSVVNQQASPFGAGWSLEDLQRLHLNADGTVLLTGGDGAAIFFDRGDRRDLLVQNSANNQNNAILRYHAQTGQLLGFFVAPNAGGLTNAHNPTFGPDGNLYVVSRGNSVLRFNGLTGEFMDVFVASNPRQTGIAQIAFGPDGNLYTDLGGPNGRQVLRYSGVDGSFLGVAAQGNGIQRVCGIAFGPDGMLYVADQDPFRFTFYDRILRFNGATGAFIDVFVKSGNLDDTCPFEFGSDGDIYVADRQDVRRFNGTNGVFKGVFASGPPISVEAFYARSGPDGLLYIANAAGIHRYRDNGTNGVLVDTFVADNTGFLNFLPERTATGSKRFDSPAGDYSTLLQNADGTFTRTLKDGTRYQFDQAGLLVSVADRNLNTTTYSYDAQARVTESTDPVGLKTTFTYAGAKLERVTDPAGRSTTWRHDADGNLVQVTFPDGATRTFGYDARHLMTVESDPRGFTTTREFDRTGRFVRSFLPDGSARQASNAQSTGMVDLSPGMGTAANPAPLRRPEDAVSFFTDGAGVMQSFQTGRFGELVRVSDGAGLFTTADRDAAGNALRETQPSGETITQSFDPRGNAISTTTTLINGTRSTAYDATFNLPTSFTDAAGNTLQINRDARGNPTQLRGALGRSTSIQYDARGLPAQFTDALGVVTTIAYDTAGRPITVTQSAGGAQRVTTFAYSSLGFISSITDPENGVTQFTRDTAGNLTSQAFPGGRVVAVGYDADGNVASITPPGRGAHTFGYSPLGLVTRYTPPAVDGVDMSITRTYDLAQRRKQIALFEGRAIDFDYDAAGRTRAIQVGAGQLVFNYSPANGTLTSLVAPDGGVLAFTYLGNRITQQAWSGSISGSVSYTYDKNDRIVSRSVNSAAPVTLAFDNDGLVTRAGNLTLTRSATTGLPAGSSVAVVSDTITYDAFGDVSGYSAAAGGSPIFAVAYTRDKLGRITSRAETIGGQTDTFAYTFDLAGNLSEVKKNGLSVARYAYDLNNNRIGATVSGVASSATYDAQDRLKTHGSATYVFSKAGQLVSRTTGPGTTQYTYDELGNLRTVALPSGTRIDYLTDGLNRRIGRKVNGTLVQGFLYQDDLRVVAELNGAGGLVSEFIYGSQVNVPDYLIKGGVAYRIISDHLGSPRLIVNAANGEIAQRLDYDEFGLVVLDTNPAFQPFGFAGGLYDSATGLVRFGARDYDAETGRWTARDPILFGGADLNLYGYALNDPINRTDLEGLLPGTKNFRKYLKDKAIDFIKGQITDLAKQLAEMEAKKCLTKEQRQELNKRLKELNKLLELAKFIDDPRAAIADKACEEVGKFLEKQWQEFLKQAEASRAGAERSLRDTIEKLIIPKQ